MLWKQKPIVKVSEIQKPDRGLKGTVTQRKTVPLAEVSKFDKGQSRAAP